MRVLHLRSSSVFGGPERQIVTLIPALSEHGVGGEVAALYRRPPRGEATHPLISRCQRDGIPGWQLPDPRPLPVRPAGALRRRLRDGGYDLLHTHDYKANLTGLLAARGLALGTVATVHLHTRSDWRLRAYHRLDRWLLRSFDQVVVVAEELATTVPAALRRAGRLWMIPNGVPVVADPSAADRERVRRELGVDASVPLLVGLGRLSRQKGFDLLLRALTELAKVRLAVAGDGAEGAPLEALSEALGIASRVRFLGFCDEVAGLLAAADLVVLPSRREGTPYALLEALALGRPVVACAVGGVRSVIADGRSGLLVPPEDPAALAAAIRYALDHPDEAAGWGRRGRQIVERHFSAAAMAAQIAGVYRRALVAA